MAVLLLSHLHPAPQGASFPSHSRPSHLVAGHQNYGILETGDFLETEDFLEMDSSASQSVVVVSPVGPGGILLEVQNYGAHPRPSESESALYKLCRGS